MRDIDDNESSFKARPFTVDGATVRQPVLCLSILRRWNAVAPRRICFLQSCNGLGQIGQVASGIGLRRSARVMHLMLLSASFGAVVYFAVKR